MPQIKSSIKRVSVNEKKKTDNRGVKSKLASAVKKFRALLASGDIAKAKELYGETVSIIDSACSKGIIHKNNADNKKAKLALALEKAQKTAQ